MHVELDLHGVPWSDKDEALFRLHEDRLVRRLSRYGLEESEVLGSLREVEDKVEGRLKVRLPGDTLTAMVLGTSTEATLQGLFALVDRRFERVRRSLDPARYRPVEADEAEVSAWRERVLRAAIPVLHNAAVHALELAETEGRVPPGALEADDLVDQVVLDNLDVVDGQEVVEDAVWALIAALWEHADQLEAPQEEEVSLDEPLWGSSLVSEDEAMWNTADEVTLDESLADLVEPEPDAVVEEIESRDRLVHALFELPPKRRSVFSQVVLDGWSRPTVAKAWRTTSADVEVTLTEASRELSEILGAGWTSERVGRIFAHLGERLRAERKADAARRGGSGGH